MDVVSSSRFSNKAALVIPWCMYIFFLPPVLFFHKNIRPRGCSTFLSCSHTDLFPVLEYLIFLSSRIWGAAHPHSTLIVKLSHQSGGGGGGGGERPSGERYGTDRPQKWIPYNRHYAIEKTRIRLRVLVRSTTSVDEPLFSRSTCIGHLLTCPTENLKDEHWISYI